MSEKFKVTVSREDGKPVFAGADKDAMFLTDQSPLLIVKKNGGTVETVCGDITALLEFTAQQLDLLGVRRSQALCRRVCMEFHSPGKS